MEIRKKEERKKEEKHKEEIQKGNIKKYKSNISKGKRLSIPKYIREKYQIGESDIAEWEEIDNHSVKITFYTMVKRLK